MNHNHLSYLIQQYYSLASHAASIIPFKGKNTCQENDCTNLASGGKLKGKMYCMDHLQYALEKERLEREQLIQSALATKPTIIPQECPICNSPMVIEYFDQPRVFKCPHADEVHSETSSIYSPVSISPCKKMRLADINYDQYLTFLDPVKTNMAKEKMSNQDPDLYLDLEIYIQNLQEAAQITHQALQELNLTNPEMANVIVNRMKAHSPSRHLRSIT